MGNMKDIGLLDCEDRPSIEENFKRVQTGGGGGGGEPDWNASEGEEGYIKNRTHYEEIKYITMAEEQSVRHSGILESSIDGYSNSKGYLDGAKIIVGNTYIVYVDGVAYKGVAYEGEVSSMTKKVCIFSPNGKDYTNAPVSITVGNSPGGTTCNVKFSDSGTHTVKVELYEYNLEPLDPKFLPEGIGGGGVFVVKLDGGFMDGYTCDKTGEEIVAAIDAGKQIEIQLASERIHTYSRVTDNQVEFDNFMIISDDQMVWVHFTITGSEVRTIMKAITLTELLI
jgi:hypothetical protein